MEPEIWRWIWLGAAGVFLLGEVIVAGGVFMLPFAGGAVVASILAFAGLGDAPQWIAFIGVSAALFIALRPVVRKLNQGENPIGVGAARLIGETGTVTSLIEPGAETLGTVRIGRESWAAETPDGQTLQIGTTIKVIEIQGTRAVVSPIEN
ncbi:MAG TPA: NfeD family protein [Acidimicrobiales bacterium]|jgi:membrane protein implicated in regulation of membrane protease activity|nr:NfeD family protein [Acidimicrobiales bacterium]